MRYSGRARGGRPSFRALIVLTFACLAMPPSASAWWNDSWRLRTKITFDNSSQGQSLVDFPVLIRLDGLRIDYSRALDLGEDLRFVDGDDATVLDHEIDVWDEAGASYVWVRVPQIDGGSATDFIYLYYDNPGALDGQNQSGAWDASFSMVHHFRENAGTHFDSTINDNDSVVVDVAAQGATPAQIYRGDVFTAPSFDHIDVADDGTLNVGPSDSITVEAWIRTLPTGSFQFVVNKKTGTADWQLHIDSAGGAAFWLYDGAEQARAIGSLVVSDDAWHYLVGRWDRATSTAEVFVDGITDGSETNALVAGVSNTEPLVMGEEGDSDRGFNFAGTLDEVRVSKTARSNGWIRAQFLSMTDAFASYGPAEPVCCTGLSTARTSVGSNSIITVTGASSFEVTLETEVGGGIYTLYDLAEDPGKTIDLAGGSTSHGSLFTDEIGSGGLNYRPSENDRIGSKARILEATETRVRVRQESRFEQNNTLLAGVKGIGDYAIYDGGKIALRWNRQTSLPVNYTFQQLQFVAHYQLAAPLDSWAAFSQTGPMPPAASGQDDFTLAQIEQPGARTDLLAILHQDWPAADATEMSSASSTERLENDWTDSDGGTIPADSSEVWNFLAYFKPTNFVDHADPAVVSRADEYRNPDTLTVTVGSGWTDPAENTAGADLFNESEAAYVLEMDPSGGGLTFDIDGGAKTRYLPFFKIRQWRSLADPDSVSLEGMTLTNDVHFKADVKPIARAPFYRELLWSSTLENVSAVSAPEVGTGGSVTGGVAPAVGRYGGGLSVPSDSDWISFPTSGNFNPARGSVGFWMKPTYDSADGLDHDIAGFRVDANNGFYLQKLGVDNSLRFRIVTTDGITTFNSDVVVLAANYSWKAGEWVHIRLEWNDTATLSSQQRLEIDEDEPSHNNPTEDYNSAFLTVGPDFYIGNINNGAPAFSPAVYDEIGVIRTGPTLAEGGLFGPAEFLADPALNFTLNFTAIDGNRRGRYLYLASDSRFRGLNVALATPGSGVAPDALDWEYRTATGWSSLEAVTGFTDETNSFTRSGTVYWGDDPPGWIPFGRLGGADLYTVRVHLGSGESYGGVFPIESVIKTDILLFQYCGNITMDGQTFAFAAPLPTAVKLASFQASGRDSSVELTWSTASELDNLGFHLYRSEREEGPYARITSLLIPGLGSSPAGASYRYRDAGLINGDRYFYKLEDVDTGGKTELHGPASAVPEEDGSRASAGGGSSAAIRYGDPFAVSLRVLERSASEMVLELTTGGFEAEPEADGSVRLAVPGFSEDSAPGAPAVPVKRSWIEVEREVRLASVRAEEVEVFRSLRPAPAGGPEMVASRRGTVKAGRRRHQEGAAFRGSGSYPEDAARLVSMGYQGEARKALLEFAPLRWDRDRAQLTLARRIVVRLSFSGRQAFRPREAGTHARRSTLVRLGTRERGLYAVSFEELFGSRRTRVADRSLRLSRQGEAVPFHVEPGDRAFGPGSMLYFVSEGEELNPYDRLAVYELGLAPGGAKMELVSASPSGEELSFYWQQVSREENRYYQAGLLEAEDLWLWDVVPAPSEKRYSFEVSRLISRGGPARLSVWVQGVSDLPGSPDHHFRVKVNGILLEERYLEGKKPMRVIASIPGDVLREGWNELSIENVGDTGASYSMVMLDRFTLAYPRALVADGSRLEGVFDGSGVAEVTDVQEGAVVLDVTPPTPRWIEGSRRTARGVSFRAEERRSYLVVGRHAVLKPEVLSARTSGVTSDLREPSEADYLVIGPRELLPEVEPLLEWRRAQGLRTRAAAVEDVYSEFGYGESRPEAVRDFLSYSYHHSGEASLRYVLLLGDGSYDFKDFLGTGVENRVPPLMVKTSYLWTASDPAYAAVNGEDILPDIAVGRLPAASADEARVMVSKILAYEKEGPVGLPGGGVAVLVADDGDAAGDFEGDAEEIATGILAERAPERIYLGRIGVEAARSRIREAFDGGASLLSYVGHGGIHLWATENVFDTSRVAFLAPQRQQPLVLTLNCLNGYFHFPYSNSLAEELLKAEGKGAVAVFSPSGLSLHDPAHYFHKAILRELLSGEHQRLGDALTAAQAAYAAWGGFPELLSIYHLLGDPALSLR